MNFEWFYSSVCRVKDSCGNRTRSLRRLCVQALMVSAQRQDDEATPSMWLVSI